MTLHATLNGVSVSEFLVADQRGRSGRESAEDAGAPAMADGQAMAAEQSGNGSFNSAHPYTLRPRAPESGVPDVLGEPVTPVGLPVPQPSGFEPQDEVVPVEEFCAWRTPNESS